MTIAQPGDIAAIVAIVAAILAGLLYLIRAQVALGKEFRRNGGSSTKDQLYRIERDIQQVRQRIDNHVDNHHKG